MHRSVVERLVADEAQALAAAVVAGRLKRIERRGTLLVAEFSHAVYAAARFGQSGTAVPLLGQRRESTVVATLACDHYDTDPPSVAFVADWQATAELPFAAWPKGPAVVERHHDTGKPFLCWPGVREFHTHVQHSDEPWDRFRGRVRPRDLVLRLADELRSRMIHV